MCFSTEWLVHLAIIAIIVVAAVAIVQVVLGQFPGIFSGPFAQIIRIVIWAVVAICLLVFLVELTAVRAWRRIRISSPLMTLGDLASSAALA